MKKFWTLLSLILAMFIFVSCISEDDEDEEAVDTGTPSDTAADSGVSGDTATDSGSETPGDSTDSSTDPSDTTPSDPGNPNCTPNCDGKECGSDGCGGQCGMCGENKSCDITSYTCQCHAKCDGKTCGDDGCGGTCSCQNIGDVCNPETKICECIPSCDGKECGNNGCGGNCGACTGGLVCDNSIGKCVVSTCVDSTCENKVCGLNGCGETCGVGDCGSSQRCSIDQTQCLVCSCDNKECGDDGCGGFCGNCPDGQGCTLSGKCVGCTCEGKVCGKNECGETCGVGCGYDQMCNADQTGCDTCTTITLKDLVQTSSSDPANRFFDYVAEYTPNGGSTKNHLSFRMYNPPYDYIELSRLPFNTCLADKPQNDNNACAFIKEYTGDIITKLYYPQKGIFTITGLTSNGSFLAPVDKQPIFAEVDMVTGEVVPGGKCYRVTNNPINAKAK